jgi:hypothetical protein
MRRAKSAPSISTRNAAADEMFLQPRMSALGQKQNVRCKKRCPLYPDSDRESGLLQKVMSEL